MRVHWNGGGWEVLPRGFANLGMIESHEVIHLGKFFQRPVNPPVGNLPQMVVVKSKEIPPKSSLKNLGVSKNRGKNPK